MSVNLSFLPLQGSGLIKLISYALMKLNTGRDGLHTREDGRSSQPQLRVVPALVAAVEAGATAAHAASPRITAEGLHVIHPGIPARGLALKNSEEQDRMETEEKETVHIKINRRRRNQIWNQWFGLGSLSPHSGAGSGFRIRSGLGLGFRMDTWSRSMGAFYWERIPTPGSVHMTTFFFMWDLRDTITDDILMSDECFLDKNIFLLSGAKLGSNPGGGLGGAGWIHARKENGK